MVWRAALEVADDLGAVCGCRDCFTGDRLRISNRVSSHEKPRVFQPGGSIRKFPEAGVEVSKFSNRIDANILHCACVNVIAGQNVAVPVGTQQALRRLEDGSGKTGMVLLCHLLDPSKQGVLVVMLRPISHERGKLNVRFITKRV